MIDGAKTTIASAKTNADGQAVFTKLPLSRNISVSIDGKLQGYTVRTSEPNEHKAAAFMSTVKEQSLLFTLRHQQ
ncbi:hypothetical protein [Streptococcus equi]|uniref:hypothetical protein n=1 Tax=Streptococcus equi TaxID=1336 RepID=UPI001E428239|nr:hypothetical protein [Streptococcus equi]